MTDDVLARLSVLCDHLGITVGSYMAARIGEALARDEMTLFVKNQGDRNTEMLAAFMAEALKSIPQDDPKE